MIRLETERLVVRDHLPDDLLSMHELLSDKLAMHYLGDIMTDSLDGTQRNLETALAECTRPDREKYYFAILSRDSGSYIGEVGYTVLLRTPAGCVANLGYFILPEFWGRGYTTEAARAVLDFAFSTGGVVKMETGCIRDNGASEAVMRKLGMVKEADYSMHVWHDGKLRDRVEYGLTIKQWKRARRGDA